MKSNNPKSKNSAWSWRAHQKNSKKDKVDTSDSPKESGPSFNDREGDVIQFHNHTKASSKVALVDILDAFRTLEDPQSRIFGGVMFGTSWQTNKGKERIRVFDSLNVESDTIPPQPHFLLISGVASPGSRVDVVLADEAGVVQSDTTVYTDAAGNWIVPFEGIETSETTWLVQIAILQAAWSGTVEPRNLIAALPGGRILSHEGVRSTEEGELYGVIFPTDGSSLTNSPTL